MILSAQSIRANSLITPWNERTQFDSVYGIMTYGVGPAGYDVRVEFGKGVFQEAVWLPPGKFLLASTMEKFSLFPGVLGIVHDKSSWARRGLTVQNTVIEPGWRGFLTLELTNHSDKDLCIEHGAPIAQVVFHWLDSPTEKPYNGKYQDQERGPQPAR